MTDRHENVNYDAKNKWNVDRNTHSEVDEVVRGRHLKMNNSLFDAGGEVCVGKDCA